MFIEFATPKDFSSLQRSETYAGLAYHRQTLRSAGARIYLLLRSINIWLRWSQGSWIAKVMIDVDLAELYDVPTYRLNEAVKRNRRRFPSDFMFQLSKKEAESLRSQFAISNTSQGASRSQFATSSF
jgi:hypothetical protein